MQFDIAYKYIHSSSMLGGNNIEILPNSNTIDDVFCIIHTLLAYGIIKV